MNTQPGKLLRLYVSEHDRYNGKPLYEAIVDRCHDLKIAGVTVYKGLEGFGHTAEMHRPHLFTHDQPIIITVVESPERAAEALPVLRGMMTSGVIAITDVEMTFVSNGNSLPAA